MKRLFRPQPVLLAAGIAGFLVLFIITLMHRQPPLHDEPYFLHNVALYQETGLSRDFLLEMKDQAPGPLYQFVHTALLPFTGLDVPGVRLVNVFFLGAIIVLLALLLRQIWQADMKKAWAVSLCVLAAPVVWQVSGMALTEIPSLFFSFASVVVLWFALKTDRTWPALGLGLLAGALAGLGILGRAPFLVLLPAGGVMALMYLLRKDYLRVVTIIIYGVVALASCLPVFLIWKGFTPPAQAYISHGFSIWHGLLGFGYAALITLILAPRWFVFNRKTLYWMAGGYLVCLALNLFVLHFTYAPLNKGLEKIMPGFFMRLYPFLISPFLCVLAIYFMVCMLIWLKRYVATPFKVFLIFLIGLLLCSNFAVTHLFSSRYIAQIVPFLILVLWPAEEINHSKIARYAVGMIIGIVSLETYFNFA